jgi:hypothetical protein
MSEKLKVISLGWGVQSWTIAAMVALGDLPPVDVAIHADTTFERESTYAFAKKWTPWLESYGVKVVTVKNQKAEIVTNRVGGEIYIPAFTNTPGGKGGQLRRQCTQKWKIAPMRQWMQANRNGRPVELWLGISTDEYRRMRDSDVQYINNVYPLINLQMSRSHCIEWLIENGLEVPQKSACYFCPYHSKAEWKTIQGEDRRKAIEVDKGIRKVRPPYDLFIHPARRPFEELDLRTETERGQLEMWGDECAGICGV